jgi:hypothetical protein
VVEERLEDPLLRGLAHAHARVRNRYPHESAGLDAVGIPIGLLEGDVFDVDVDVAPAGHGLPGIEKQVDHDLLDLAAVHLDGIHTRAGAEPDTDVFSGALEHLHRVPHQVLDAGGQHLVFAPRAKPRS